MTHLSATVPTKQRKRAYGKRSRTGCRSCRARRVKCDETPGACQNCTSSGWACGGYDSHRLPPAARGKVMPQVTDGFRWAMTSDERRCFSYFQHHTIPTLLEMFDSPLWRKLVLQMSYSEPAVYHAAVALSAVHEDAEGHGFPLPGQARQGTWQQFALDQSLRSFGILNRRHSSQDPKLREVMLLCCLLYVFLELLSGHHENACRHLRSGLQILKEARAHRQLIGASESPVETCLVAAFAELDIQSPFVGAQGMVLCLDDEVDQYSWLASFPFGFHSIFDAQRAFAPFMYGAYGFVAQCWPLTEEQVMANYDALQSEQRQLLSHLIRFADLCEPLYASYLQLSRKEQRGVDIIHAHQRHMVLEVSTCLLPRHSPVRDCFTPHYRAHLGDLKSIIRKAPECPSLSLFPSLLPCLYAIVLSCHDYDVCLEATEELHRWIHCEGMFNSAWLALQAIEHVRLDFLEEELSLGSSSPDTFATVMNEERSHLWSRIEDMRWRITRGRPGYLDEVLQASEYMRTWVCVRALQMRKARLNELLSCL
ncbi:C6 zinc finger domain protein [Aspergillus sclerotioniger CBS 115572]|uniref:C6 zinc finger domain protein n=1 Tax=Aspergillus sclerotioniger CBS 115572 TaxID=1450535 RepID=A0A317W6E7_9EURO|nr:C6 zinc finger domain protein [Aspergillus sclerotioniger CBS 115572]PWY80882.1 C6 zinc finger domain protein [Aspergillus sclerotioniger CBS 115572]